MEQNLSVADMRVGDNFEGYYILRSAAAKISSNGKPFLSAVLGDATGDVDAKVWDYHGSIGPADEGQVLKIRGTVTEFRGALQVNVDKIRLAEDGDAYDPASLVPTAPIDPEVQKKILGDEKPLTGRYADTLEPAFEKTKAELGDTARSDEDVLSYIAFPQLAEKFFADRQAAEENVVKYTFEEM